jgi:hypothetical protein
MSLVATKAISAKLFVGTFDLRIHLLDHTTEEIANMIIAEVNKVHDGYRARNPREQVGTPRFAFGGVEGDNTKIDLYVMAPGNPNIQMGVIGLKWKKVGERGEQLVIRKQARQQLMEHMNAGFTISDLKTALSIRNISLKDGRNEILAHSLDLFETLNQKHPATFTFDLELTDEGVTVVAYRDFKRHSVITAFAQ